MNKQFISGTLLIFTILLTSCAKYFSEEDEEESDQQKVSMLRINPRSGDEAELLYPINIYAFDAEGNCAGKQSIESSEKEPSIELELAKGAYRIVVVSGISEKEYTIPDKPTLSDVIEIKQNNRTEIPLMMGNANVTLKGETTKANITLNFMVAKLKVTLSNIPSGYSNVEVEIASSYSKLSLNGEYIDGNHNVLVPCRRMTNGEWDTGIFYTFAGSQKKTIISIHLTKDDTTETYGYTYNNSIPANHPFILVGSYAKSISVAGDIIAGGWAEPITVDFTFGNNSSEDDKPDDGKDDNDEEKDLSDIFTVDQFPEEESIWNDCIVLKVSENNSGDEADVLLMGIDNATNNMGKDKILIADAIIALGNYNKSGISNWRIPTEEEAQLLKSRYNSNLGTINQLLSNVSGTLLVLESPRYLCNNAELSFNFKSGSISPTGNKTFYYLRPVKTVHLVKH